MATGWRKAEFSAKHPNGDVAVSGWVRGHFGLDRRKYRKGVNVLSGWVITHIPTGFIVRGYKGGLTGAKRAASALLAAADWDFTDPNEAKARGPAVKLLMDEFPLLVPASGFSGAVPAAAVASAA